MSSMSFLLLFAAAGIWLGGPAYGDTPSPLAEMRQAAEAAAEVEPERPSILGAHTEGQVARGHGVARREAVHAAVRGEVEKEWAQRAQGRGPALVSAAVQVGQGPGTHGESASAQARSEAAQAQQAARSHDVEKQ